MDMAERANSVQRLRDSRPSRSRTRAYLRLIAAKKRPFARIRVAVRRCFMLSPHITTRMVLERAHPRLRRYLPRHYLAAVRALRLDATIVARHRFGRGRPCLWARHGRDMPPGL